MVPRKRNVLLHSGLIGFACIAVPSITVSASPAELQANPAAVSAVRPLLPPDSFVDAPPADSRPKADSIAASKPEPAAAPAARLPRTLQSEGQIGIEVNHNPGVDTVALKVGASAPRYTVQQLENPPRLVLDIESVVSRSNRSISTKTLEFVSGVRIGAHPDKSRIVLDLHRTHELSHEESVVDGAILVTLRGAPKAVVQEQEQESNEAKADAVPAAQEAMQPEADLAERIAEARDVSESDEEAEPASLAEVEREAEDLSDASRGIEIAKAQDAKIETVLASLEAGRKSGLAEVTKLSLSSGEGASASEVRVATSGKGEFRLERTAPSEYVLTLAGAKLSSTIKRDPIISPATGAVIRSARPTTVGEDVLVRIFVQPSAYLTARREKGEVVVSETHDLTQVVKDIRAQLSPADTAEKEKAAAAEKSEETPPPTAPSLPPETKDSKDAKAKKEPKQQAAARAKGSKTATEITDADIDALLGDKSRYTGRLISLDLQETDIDNALRIIAEVSNLNIVASEDVKGKVTLRLLDVPWDQALDVILKTNGLDKVLEGTVMRIAPVEKLKKERENLKQAIDAEQELEPLAVKYLRVSYAKAAEIKSLVETVLSERGSVAYDERSNQLIVKDVRSGLKNVVELVNKVDLRTPQVLLETQIVESTRNLTRELGSQLGFQYIQSPSTGNGTGLNFPSSIAVGGSAAQDSILGSSFPVVSNLANGSAVSMLFDSADGTKSLELRLSQLEQEGKVRIISRPAVATTNNKAAEIKSVEKFRVKLPNGGLSVATGAGAQASGTSNTATEVIEAGITLNVTPQASPDYYILLDIKARSSTFGTKEVEGIPNEFERSASSTVLVSSGQTFALGGIYKMTEADRVTGVPFFKDIPVLGTFFRRTVTDDSDEELLFFITPRIVEGSFDDASMKAIS